MTETGKTNIKLTNAGGGWVQVENAGGGKSVEVFHFLTAERKAGNIQSVCFGTGGMPNQGQNGIRMGDAVAFMDRCWVHAGLKASFAA